MFRISPFLLVILFIFILPTAAGRLLIDVAGGLMVLFFSIPILLGGAGWIGWRILKSRLVTCEACGASIINSSEHCPVCGSQVTNRDESMPSNNDVSPASSATIDITAKDAGSED